MESINCLSIKDSLIDYLNKEVEIAAFKDRCILTLPLKTVDDRYVDVTVERKMPDYFLVHDAGKSISELFMQGISLTESRRKTLEAIAKTNRADLIHDVFTVGCKAHELQNAILAIGLCSTMAMLELIGHKAEIEEEPLAETINRSLKRWQPQFIRSVDRRVSVKGRKFPHFFDFVTFAADESAHHTAAIKLLPPSYGGQIQAERYAYLVIDIEGTPYHSWPRLAVVSKVETWPPAALKMIKSLSARTLELRTGEESLVTEELSKYMDALVA